MLLCCGDVESNPGPLTQDSCSICFHTVKDDQDSLLCEFALTCLKLITTAGLLLMMAGSVLVVRGRPYPSTISDSSIWSHPSISTSTATALELQTHSHSHLTKILTINARSILPKVDKFRSLCATLQPTAIVVTETWLSSCVLDNEVLINGYNLVRKDRNRHGRGVAIYVSSVLPFKRLHFPHSRDLKLVLVECFINT